MCQVRLIRVYDDDYDEDDNFSRECYSFSRNISVRNCGQFLVYKLKRLLCVTYVTVATDCQVLHQVKITQGVNFTRAF